MRINKQKSKNVHIKIMRIWKENIMAITVTMQNILMLLKYALLFMQNLFFDLVLGPVAAQTCYFFVRCQFQQYLQIFKAFRNDFSPTCTIEIKHEQVTHFGSLILCNKSKCGVSAETFPYVNRSNTNASVCHYLPTNYPKNSRLVHF